MTASREMIDLMALVGSALDLPGFGLCLCGSEGTISHINAAFIRLCGAGETAGTVIGKNISSLSRALPDLLESALNENDVSGREIIIDSESGGARRVMFDAVIRGSGDDWQAAIIARDCSLNGPMDQAIRLGSLLDNIEDGYYECDIAGNITYANKALCGIVECRQEEIIGNKYNFFFDDQDVKKIYQAFHEIFTTGTPRRISNWVGLTKSGRKKLIETSVSPVRGQDGCIVGFRGIIRDLTEKSKMENELIRARRLEAIGIFAGGIAHDYNNALTAILGNISLAKMEADPANQGLAEVLDDAEAASIKAVELTKRLSTFAQGGRPERKLTHYGDSLWMTIETVLSRYPGKRAVNIHHDLWDVDIDEFQINQVVSYMLDNAIESMTEPGTITVTAENIIVEREETHHEISLQTGKYVRVSIQDEGCGIPPDDIYRIFDPYYTTKEMANGMGLATSYAIIKRHHGYIDVKSVVGKGSTFFIYIPVANM